MDKARLLTKRLKRGEVEIPDVGVVQLRALSREELLTIDHEHGPLRAEQQTLALALVDPVMTEDEVAEWQRCSEAGELGPVMEKVNELSGINRGAGREAYKSVRGQA